MTEKENEQGREREREGERERERVFEAWYIALAHRQAWCFADYLVYLGLPLNYLNSGCFCMRKQSVITN